MLFRDISGEYNMALHWTWLCFLIPVVAGQTGEYFFETLTYIFLVELY